MVLNLRQVAFHLRRKWALGRMRPAAWVDRDRRAADAQLTATQRVVVLGVVVPINSDAGRAHVGRSLTQGLGKLGRALRRPKTNHDARDHVAGGVEHRGELGLGRMLGGFPRHVA